MLAILYFTALEAVSLMGLGPGIVAEGNLMRRL